MERGHLCCRRSAAGRSARCRAALARRARAIVAALYLGLNLVFIYATPLEQMKGVIAIGSLAASNLFGPSVAGVFAALMALSIVSTVNAEVTIGPRVYYAMAKNRAFFARGGNGASRVAHAGGGDPEPGRCAPWLMTLTPFPRTGDLHRDEPDAVHGALGGFAVRVPAEAGRAGSGCGRWISACPLIPGSLHPGGSLHDDLRRDLSSPWPR